MVELTSYRNFWNNRPEKFEKEKQLLLVLDDMLSQIQNFTLENKIVDFVKIADNLSHHNLNPKQCIKYWDSLKKNLKDLYKREHEYQAICRNEVNEDFWSEHLTQFRKRLQIYQKQFSK